MVNQIQVPNFAGTIQNGIQLRQQGKRDELARRQQGNKVSQQEQAKAFKIYNDGAAKIREGIETMTAFAASSPEQDLRQLSEFNKLLAGSAQQIDNVGAQLGILGPSLVQEIQQAFQTVQSGTEIATNAGTLSGIQTNAQTAATDQVAQGSAAGVQAATSANTQAVTAQQLGTPAVVGANAAAQANTQLAGTDQAAIGVADAQQTVAKQQELFDFVQREFGLTGEDAINAKKQIFGLDEKGLDVAKLEIAVNQMGPEVRAKMENDQPLTPQEFQLFIATMKQLNSSDSLVQQLQQAFGNQPQRGGLTEAQKAEQQQLRNNQ